MPNGFGNMPSVNVYNLKGINLKLSPFNAVDGSLIRCTNMYTDQVGSKTKRWGFTDFPTGTSGGSNEIRTLAQYQKNDGTTNYLYKCEGSVIYYYNLGAGTGDWTVCTNGTVTGGEFGYTTFDDTFIIGDGVGSTKHTTDGTAFVDTGSTAAGTPPIGRYITNEFGRVFIGGTASDVFYSSANDGTNWLLSGAYDSSSFKVTGGGKINGIWNVADRVLVSKTNGVMKKWDDYQLTTVPTNKGYSFYESVANLDGYLIGLNKQGVYGFGGDKPELLSNPIEYQIFNGDNGGIDYDYWTDYMPGAAYRYKYLLGAQKSDDARSGNILFNAVFVYDAQMDEWFNWSLNTRTEGYGVPTAFLNYKDANNEEQLLIGDSEGAVYKFDPTSYTDAGNQITCLLEGFVHAGAPDKEKVWRKISAFANPGCQATLMLAASDTFVIPKSGNENINATSYASSIADLNYVSVGSLKNGVVEYQGALRGRFLYYKVIESSTTYPFTFYGFNIEYDFIGD